MRGLQHALALCIALSSGAQLSHAKATFIEDTNLFCAAIDQALNLGFATLEGTKFLSANGQVHTRGAVTPKEAPNLSVDDQVKMLVIAEEYRLGATDYVNNWIVPLEEGREPEPHSPEAQRFITEFIRCLDRQRD